MTDTPEKPRSDTADGYGEEVDHILVSRPSPGVVLVELSNPARRNAMSMQMTAAWQRLVAELGEDRTVRCVAVTGTGSAFCSGGETGWIGGDAGASVARLRERMEPFYRTWLSMRGLQIPVIAGINGPAVGAGACLALSADIRLASDAARFSVPFLSLGMHSGMGTTYLLPEAVGVAAARDLLLTGRTADAAEMLRLGIVSRVLPSDGFRDAFLHEAEAVAAKAPLATRLTKAALKDGGMRTLDDAIRWEALAQPVTLATADLVEGLAAARERRAPVFRGE